MRKSLVVLAASCLLALPALAEDTISGGIDVWRTLPNGKTFSDFSREPIPSGFFCPGSKAFTGIVRFKGEPVVTDTPGALQGIDTVVQRLDDAVFSDRGQAMTRLQLRALNLVSMAPITTECGAFNVRANLAPGSQPITHMRIFRDGDNNGRYLAPLALNVKLTFTPVGRGRAVSMVQPVRFPASSLGSWAVSAEKATSGRWIKIDTDGDRVADTLVPGPSSFKAGRALNKSLGGSEIYADQFLLLEEWHNAPTHEHVVDP